MATTTTVLTTFPGRPPGDGLCIYFFDAHYEFFPGGIGGSLGYTNYAGPLAFNAKIYSGVTSIQITNGGSGYTSTPTVVFDNTSTGGSGAAGTAVVADGAVASITITSPGTLYNSAPTISFTAAGCSPAAATGTDALKVTGGTAQHNDAFTVLVPEAAGGLAGDVTITVLARTSMGSTPSVNQIHWHLTGNDAVKIANLQLAINGTSDTSKVKFGSGITNGATVGIKGITGSNGTSEPYASLTADNGGTVGNDIAITDTVGTVLVNESALTDGKLAGGTDCAIATASIGGDNAAVNPINGAYLGIGLDVKGNFGNTSEGKTGSHIEYTEYNSISSCPITTVSPNTITVRSGTLSSYRVVSTTADLTSYGPMSVTLSGHERYGNSPPLTLHQEVTSKDDIVFNSARVTLQNDGKRVRIELKSPTDGLYYPYQILDLPAGLGEASITYTNPTMLRAGLCFATSDSVMNCEIKNFSVQGKMTSYRKVDTYLEPPVSAAYTVFLSAGCT